MRVVAGNGSEGFADGTGAAARFRKPIRLAPYGEDGVVVADIFNHAIRVVTRDGRVTTLVGGPDRKGHRDGPATEAQLSSPHGVAGSPRASSRWPRPQPHDPPAHPGGATEERRYVVSTLAGSPGQEGMRDGPAEQALFSSPHAASAAATARLLVPDIGNARIRRIHEEVKTVAGARGGRRFTYPMDIALGPDGTLLIADAANASVRLLTPDGRSATLKIEGELHTPHGIAPGRRARCTSPT